jgi:hypothetical protein
MNLRDLPGAARTAAWLVASGGTSALAPTWPLEESERARLEVTWPTRYQWGNARYWVEPLRYGIERLVRLRRSEIRQPYKGIVVMQVAVDGAPHDVVIDYSDYPEVNVEAADATELYFKMQFVPGSDGRVVPGGFTPWHDRIYRYLPHLRRLRDRRRFEHEVYGRFGSSWAADVRARAVRILTEQNRVSYEGGLAPVRYAEYLREVARSRVCIDLPGNGDFCFRLVEYLAVGSCVIGPRPRTALHVPLVSGEHVVHAADDLSDLLDLCERYVEDDETRERIATNARSYFDRYLDRRQLAGWYLRNALDRFG